MTDIRKVDPGHGAGGAPFDDENGLYGQEYHRDREAAMGRERPSGTVAEDKSAAPHPAEGGARQADIPADNGRRASFDPRTGEVHGSGSSAGGGSEGDDFSSDSEAGDGYPFTGREGTVQKAPDDLGPPHFKE